jgi:hypothetical protein
VRAAAISNRALRLASQKGSGERSIGFITDFRRGSTRVSQGDLSWACSVVSFAIRLSAGGSPPE